MYPVVSEGENYWQPVFDFPEKVDRALPTFDKTLDAYFDRSFAAIIDEWGLITETDLHNFEGRLSRATNEISALCAGKSMIERRIENLEATISSLEGTL